MAASTPDPDFLAYADHRDPEAFRRLVCRHLPAVEATARRTLGIGGHLAADVAQGVFLRLAHKAPILARDMIVSAWLHRQTVRLALNTRRGEIRRERREAAANELTTMHAPDDEPVLQELSPLLDQALLRLREADRQALALRYFENLSLKEVGGRLGITAVAAQKRIERGLEKLRGHFTARATGAVSVATLTTMLSSRSAEASTPALARSISNHILSATPSHISVSTKLLFLMAQSKAIVVGVAAGLLASVATSGIPLHADASSGRTAQVAAKNSDSSPAATRSRSVFSVPLPASTGKALFQQVSQLLDAPDTKLTQIRLEAFLAQLATTQFEALLAEANVCPSQGLLRRLLSPMVAAWVKVDPQAAVLGAAATLNGEGRSYELSPSHFVPLAFEAWFAQDFDEAANWWAAHLDDPALRESRSSTFQSIGESVFKNSPDKFLDWFHNFEADDRTSALFGIAVAGQSGNQLLELLEQNPDPDSVRSTVVDLLNTQSYVGNNKDALYEAAKDSPFRNEIIRALCADDCFATSDKLKADGVPAEQLRPSIIAALQLADSTFGFNPEKTMEWLEEGPQRDDLLARMAQLERGSAKQTLSVNGSNTTYDDGTNPINRSKDELRWATGITGAAKRQEVVSDILNHLPANQREKLSEALEKEPDAWPQDIRDAVRPAGSSDR